MRNGLTLVLKMLTLEDAKRHHKFEEVKIIIEEDNSTTHSEDVMDDSCEDGNDSESSLKQKGDNSKINIDGNDHNGSPKKDEKQLCIGSIFGLDVGGTLAKLVYFEKKALDSDPPQTRSIREKHYVQAVSAQTVLMANMEDNARALSHSAKRSSSMSPMRKFPRPEIIAGSNRCRSSTGDEFALDNVIIRNTTTTPNHMPQRRTLAVDNMHPVKMKEIQKGQPEILESPVEEDEEETQRLTQQTKDEDLKNLYAIRQESLPDDIRQFRHSVDFLPSSTSTKEVHKLDESFISESKDSGENNRNIDDDENDNHDDRSAMLSTPAPPTLTKRSISMLDLSAQHDQQKAEALNRFYDFARRLDTHEDSISDIKLSFYCRELGGEFHFISFETRKMKNAMDLIRFNNLHMNIRNMG